MLLTFCYCLNADLAECCCQGLPTADSNSNSWSTLGGKAFAGCELADAVHVGGSHLSCRLVQALDTCGSGNRDAAAPTYGLVDGSSTASASAAAPAWQSVPWVHPSGLCGYFRMLLHDPEQMYRHLFRMTSVLHLCANLYVRSLLR